MKTQFLAGLLGLCLASGAGADIRAVYQGSHGGDTVVEIAEAGAIRIGRRADPYADYELYLGGEAFRVIAGPGGPIVLTMAAAEVLANHERAQTVVFGDDGGAEPAAPEVWTPVEQVTIAGIAGQRLEVQGALSPGVVAAGAGRCAGAAPPWPGLSAPARDPEPAGRRARCGA